MARCDPRSSGQNNGGETQEASSRRDHKKARVKVSMGEFTAPDARDERAEARAKVAESKL